MIKSIRTIKAKLKKANMPTIVIGKEISGACGLGGSASSSIAIDKNGNIARVCNVSVGAGTPAASVGAFVSLYETDSYKSILGGGLQYGASAGEGFSLGVEHTISFNDTGITQGVTFSATGAIYAPAPGEFHAYGGGTYEEYSINLFDFAEYINDKVENW